MSFPGPRIAYDLDGSVGFFPITQIQDNSHDVVQFSQVELQALNADYLGGLVIPNTIWSFTSPYTYDNFISICFRRPMRIDGWFASAMSAWAFPNAPASEYVYQGLYIEFESSWDTTNGIDGDWHSLGFKDKDGFHLRIGYSYPNSSIILDRGYIPPNGGITYDPNGLLDMDSEVREDGTSVGKGWLPVFGSFSRNVMGVRLRFPQTGPRSAFRGSTILFHLYGSPDVNSGDERLVFLDTDSGSVLDRLDWNEVEIGSESVRTFCIRNTSTEHIATGLSVDIQGKYPSESVPSTYYPPWIPTTGSVFVSSDGLSWSTTVSIGDLPPGETSEPIYARCVPAPGLVGRRVANIIASTEGWM